jgi:small subunit ribosomal protein S20
VATHRSAEKRARQAEKRRQGNRPVRGRLRGAVKDVHAAILAGDAEAARGSLRRAERVLRKAASRGVIPAQRASRKVSRLARAVARLS